MDYAMDQHEELQRLVAEYGQTQRDLGVAMEKLLDAVEETRNEPL